jgi:hypothetical protein
MFEHVRLSLAATMVVAGTAGAQTTTRESVDSSGSQADMMSQQPAISADGIVVAFQSYADDLVPGDTNVTFDVFVHDRATGVTERVSVDSSGAEANDESSSPALSADGQVVAFASYATNLVAGDFQRHEDVFVHDRTTGVTERVSVDSSGTAANGDSFGPAISADGNVVAFTSYATNLAAHDANGRSDIYLHDRTTGVTERISVDSSGKGGNLDSSGPAISADGQVVAFHSDATNLVAGDTNGSTDVFVHDRLTGITERISVDSTGGEASLGGAYPAISADGQIVAFDSPDPGLVGSDTNGAYDVFVRDRGQSTTERVSVDSSGVEGNSDSFGPSISSDGSVVAFDSFAWNLVPGDSNLVYDAFVHDRIRGSTQRVSVDSSGAEGNLDSGVSHISADGLNVAFFSRASNLVAGDTNGASDVFVHERCVVEASWSNYGAGFPGTYGVPDLLAQSDPFFGHTITLDLGNSSAQVTVGLVFIGFQQASIPSGWGGELLVLPVVTDVVGLFPGGASLDGGIPMDEGLCGFEIDLQAIESDPGAARGVSFSQGLQLVLGH